MIVTVMMLTWGNESLPGFSSNDEDANCSGGKRGNSRHFKEEGNARKSNSRVTDDSSREFLKEITNGIAGVGGDDIHHSHQAQKRRLKP